MGERRGRRGIGTRLLSVYILNQSVHWFIVGLYFPIMVLFLLDKGLDILHVGTVVGAYSATVILLELPTGGLSDSIGRKRVYLSSVAVQFVSMAALIVSWNYAGLLLGFIGVGVARALSSGTIDAWFVDEFNREQPKGNLQAAVAKAQVFIPIGIAAGSLVGGIIPMTFGELVKDALGLGIYSANLIVIVIALAVQFALTSALVMEVANSAHRGSVLSGLKAFPDVLSTSVRYGIRNRVVLLLMIASLALGFGLASIELFWQPRLKDLLGGAGQTWVFGAMAAGYFLSASVGNVLITPLCSRLGNSYATILLGLRVLMGSTLVALALQNSIPGFVLFFLMVLMVNGMSNSPHVAIFNSQVPGERRSTMMSFESLVLQTGGMTGSFVLGFLAQEYSITTAWFISGGALAVSAATYLLLALRRPGQKLGAACDASGRIEERSILG